MAYTKQTWQTGETITQEKLNHMEDGIADASNSIELFIVHFSSGEGSTYESDKSAEEIREAITNGKVPFGILSVEADGGFRMAADYAFIQEYTGTCGVRFSNTFFGNSSGTVWTQYN